MLHSRLFQTVSDNSLTEEVFTNIQTRVTLKPELFRGHSRSSKPKRIDLPPMTSY